MAIPVTPIYASEIVSGFDVWKPDLLEQLFRKFGDQGSGYFMLLRSLDFEKAVAQNSYGHFEDDRKHVTFQTRNIVSAPGVGASAAITLNTTDLDAGNRFYPRKWDTVIFANEVTGTITDINVTTPSAPVLTVVPNTAADDIGGLAAGDRIAIISNAFSEGSGQPVGAVTASNKYTNYTQIIKESLEVTGTEMTNQTWLQLKGLPGAPYFYSGLTDIDYRMNLRIEGALLFQKLTTSTITDTVTGRNIQTTEGLIPYIRRVGNLYPYTPGTLSVADFDALDRTLDANFAGNYIMGLLGINVHQEFENVLYNYFQDTNIEYARDVVNEELLGGEKGKAASVNFKMLTKSERTFMFKRMKTFSNSNTYGVTGFDQPNMAVWLPINSAKDPMKGDNVRSIGYRYKALGPYSRKMEIWDVRGAGEGLKVTEFDKQNTYMRCHIGAHHRGGNQFILMHT
jgi:hypothetical protein